MKKEYKVRNNKLNFNLLLIAGIIFSTCFLAIGYAAIEAITLDVTATAHATAQEGIFISNVQYDSNVDASTMYSEINNYAQTVLDSTVFLSSTNKNSSITYEIKIYNNSNNNYYFSGTKVVDSFYDNDGIMYTLEGIEIADMLNANSMITFKITFSYKNSTLADSNELNSYIKFLFENVNDVKLAQLINNGKTQKQLVSNSDSTATFKLDSITGVVARCNNNATPVVSGTEVKMTNITAKSTTCQIFDTLKESMETVDNSVNNMLMIANETTTKKITTAEGKTINFNLNGKQYTAANGLLSNYATLKIYDSKYVKGSSSNTGYMKSNGVSFDNNGNGKLTFDSVKCTNNMNTSVSAYSHVLHAVDGETFVNNATFTSEGYTILNVGSASDSFVQVDNSIIENNSTGQESAVYSRSLGSIFSIINSTLIGNSHGVKTAGGGRIYIANCKVEASLFDLYSTGDGDRIYYSSNNIFINGTTTPSSKIISNTTGLHVKNYITNTSDDWIYVKDSEGNKMTYSDGKNIYVGDELYINSYSGLVLDAESDSMSSGTNIRVYNKDTTTSQKFTLLANDAVGYYNVVPYYSPGFAMDIAGASTANGTNIRLYTINDTTAQRYTFINTGDYVQIKSGKNTFVDTDEGTENPVSGTNVESWAQSNDTSQLWKITK